MVNPFAILWRSVVNCYDDLFPLVGMNLVWLVLTIPVVAVIVLVLTIFGLPAEGSFILAILLAMILPTPASIGLHYYANQLVKEERVEFDLFWAGLKALWKRSLALFAIGFAATALLVLNLTFYATNVASPLKLIAILWVYALILWVMMQMYVNPLLVEQENKSIKLILRNAFILTIDNLVTSFVLLVVLVALSAVSVGIALLVALLTGSFLAVVETRAVLTFLEKYRARMANQPR
jgi:uncharacterized membrane protein YesL